MVQISARVVPAGDAIALGIEGSLGEFVHGPPQLKFPVRGKGQAALRALRRHDAVEHVDASMNGLEQIQRCAHTHQVARQARRQNICDAPRNGITLEMGLTDSKAANRQTIEWKLA